jgi:hypothetical protein
MTNSYLPYNDDSDNLFIPQTFQQFTANQSAAIDNIIRLERIHNQFHLSPTESAELDKYYILHWEGTYLIKQMTETVNFRRQSTELTHQDVTYRVNFLYVSPWEIVTNPHKQYALSFRKAKIDKLGTVIIKKVGL